MKWREYHYEPMAKTTTQQMQTILQNLQRIWKNNKPNEIWTKTKNKTNTTKIRTIRNTGTHNRRMIKVTLNKRNNKMYPYSISYMNREEVLLTEKELLNLSEQINEIIINDELWEKI